MNLLRINRSIFLKKTDGKTYTNLMRRSVTTSTKALIGSSEVSYLIAKNKNPRTIVETLFLPAVMKMCEITHRETCGKALETPSNNTVTH
jgi:hypothetical protein